MKKISFIISIMIFCVSVFPCTDALASHGHSHIEGNEHHENDPNEPHCSPLCFCACCGINVIELSYNMLEEICCEAPSPIVFNFDFQYQYDPILAFWQPPRNNEVKV